MNQSIDDVARVLGTVNPYDSGQDVSGHAMEDLFPRVDPEFKPFGARVLVQLRRVISTTKSGLFLVSDTKDAEQYNVQVGRVIDMGPLAFKNRKSGEEWPEGRWCEVGDFVRFQRHVGDRMTVPQSDGGEPVVVLVLNDADLTGKYTGDPRKPRAYIS